MFRAITVTEHERALLIRNGELERVLAPGRHRFWDPLRRVQTPKFDVRLPAFTSEWARVMEKNHPDLARANLEVVRTGNREAALVSFEDAPALVVAPGKTAYFWNVLRDIAVERVDLDAVHEMDAAFHQTWKDALGSAAAVVAVPENHAGMLVVDGAYVEPLKPGKRVFWALGRAVTSWVFDLRPQPIEVAAQEILTKDRVSLRLTLTAFVTVTDPEKVARAIADHTQTVYRFVQFAAREAIGGRTLDQVLNDRVKVDEEIAAQVRARLANLGDVGLEVGELRVKDVILPGDMRELLNKVVEAEKAAQANLIRRQEETAATRSLLNTARLMDDNPTLMRLKELEALEKVTEKIGRIDLHAGQGAGLDALLNGLVRLGERKDQD